MSCGSKVQKFVSICNGIRSLEATSYVMGRNPLQMSRNISEEELFIFARPCFEATKARIVTLNSGNINTPFAIFNAPFAMSLHHSLAILSL